MTRDRIITGMPLGGWMASLFTLLAFHCYLQLLGWGSSEALHFWEGRERQKEYGRREIKGKDGGKSCAYGTKSELVAPEKKMSPGGKPFQSNI